MIPEPLQSGDSIEPEVNIIQKDDRIIEEYRVQGQALYDQSDANQSVSLTT